MQLYLGGIVSMSTVDWPKNISMVIFFAGCDFRCPYCQNADLIEFKEDFLKDIKDVKKEIKKNYEFIDGVLFSGGETTLQRSALLELARYAKQIGLKVGVETNGSKPAVINSLLKEKLLDFVGVDLKSPFYVDLFDKVTKSSTFFKPSEDVIKDVKHTLSLLKRHQDELEIEIRTTVVPGLIFRKEDMLEIAEEIKDLECVWALQQFRSSFGKVLDPMYKNIDSPSKEFLENLKRFVLTEYPNLRIEVKAS